MAVELTNEVEARLLAAMLQEAAIPHMVRSYHDSAYDGIFQSQFGWGRIEAPTEYHDQIRQMLDDLREDQQTNRDGT